MLESFQGSQSHSTGFHPSWFLLAQVLLGHESWMQIVQAGASCGLEFEALLIEYRYQVSYHKPQG